MSWDEEVAVAVVVARVRAPVVREAQRRPAQVETASVRIVVTK